MEGALISRQHGLRDLIAALVAAIVLEGLIIWRAISQTNRGAETMDWLNAIQAPGGALGEWVTLNLWVVGIKKVAVLQTIGLVFGAAVQVALLSVLSLGAIYLLRIFANILSSRSGRSLRPDHARKPG